MVYLSPLSLMPVEPLLSSQKLLPWHAYNQRETRDYDKVPLGECHKGGGGAGDEFTRPDKSTTRIGPLHE